MMLWPEALAQAKAKIDQRAVEGQQREQEAFVAKTAIYPDCYRWAQAVPLRDGDKAIKVRKIPTGSGSPPSTDANCSCMRSAFARSSSLTTRAGVASVRCKAGSAIMEQCDAQDGFGNEGGAQQVRSCQ